MNRFLTRSVLFAPADRLKVLEKAIKLAPDVLVFDLEDSVSPLKKSEARENLLEVLSASSSVLKSKIIIRINCPITTPFGEEDIKFLMSEELLLGKIDGVGVPKVDSLEALTHSINLFGSKPKPLWAMIETAKGIKNVHSIAESNHVTALVFGQNDLCKDLKLPAFNREALLYSMSQCIVAARAEDKSVIDGVFMDITDSKGLEADCIHGLNLGFDGKSLIHPNQIDIVNAIYTPSEESLTAAKRVIEAFEQAQREGKSVAMLDGRLIEALHGVYYTLLLYIIIHYYTLLYTTIHYYTLLYTTISQTSTRRRFKVR